MYDGVSIDNCSSGLMSRIQRFKVHYGPRIRILIFVKSSPLRCLWCYNPESQSNFPEIAFNENQCIEYIECGLCKSVCCCNAITAVEDGKIKIDRQLCANWRHSHGAP